MSLIAKVQINENLLAVVAVQRVAPLHAVGEDTECTYQWHIRKRGGIPGDNSSADQRGQLTHRHGDGALELLRATLEAAGHG